MLNARAKQLDNETARVIMATLASGVLENPNNSLQARFRRKGQRDARSREKHAESQSLTGKEAQKLRRDVKAGKLQLREKDSEIEALQRKLQFLTESQPVAGPSKPSNNCEDRFSGFPLPVKLTIFQFAHQYSRNR
jgi:hypothetical protein